MSPRSLVPVDRDDIANGFSGRPNPAWDSLDEGSSDTISLVEWRSLPRWSKASTTASVGLLSHLRQTEDLDNTLILFLSDNGACYEWGPFGFDGKSRRGETILRTGDDVREIGQARHASVVRQCLGESRQHAVSALQTLHARRWHQHSVHRSLAQRNRQTEQVGPRSGSRDGYSSHADGCDGGRLPSKNWTARKSRPVEGKSLLPAFKGESSPERTIGFDHQAAHAIRKGDWKAVYAKRMPHELEWELYNLAEDRCELNDLAKQYPDRAAQMAAEWEAWARRVGVTWEPIAVLRSEPQPKIKNVELVIKATYESGRNDASGVIVCHGGNQHGYSIYLDKGLLVFAVRRAGKLFTTKPFAVNRTKASLTAKLARDGTMTLVVDGRDAGSADAGGLIAVQPKDQMTIGLDEHSAAANYAVPNPFSGTISDVSVNGTVVAATRLEAASKSDGDQRANKPPT